MKTWIALMALLVTGAVVTETVTAGNPTLSEVVFYVH